MRQAKRHGRNVQRAGHCGRNLRTRAGTVQPRVPSGLRHMPFETAITERCRRREIPVEESPARDVPGGRFRAPGGEHHRGAMGQACEPGRHNRLESKYFRTC
ncbi:transposase [uncultured Desulfovibrio sp.]|uniref:transposase n=1 Tax=uncultured Desulfovibrio sp. TaxID=167968 RepID=UPI00345BF71D